MIWLSLGGVFFLSIIIGAIFRKISIWAPGAVISLPLAYFLFQTNDNLRITQGLIYDLFSFFSTSGNISDTLLLFVTFTGGVGIWGLTSLGLALGKQIGAYNAYRITKRRGK